MLSNLQFIPHWAKAAKHWISSAKEAPSSLREVDAARLWKIEFVRACLGLYEQGFYDID